jgi:hypothetical protein
MIDSFAARIPTSLLNRSGKVFYSGRAAFAAAKPLYVLGVNPGGAPSESIEETVGSHTSAVLNGFPENWSAYRDEAWKNHAPGTYKMQPRLLHLFALLGLNAGEVPSSNLVFARSRREHDIGDEMATLADECWPVHALVIEQLRPRAVLCLGKTAGDFVRNKLGAHTVQAEFVEQNNRRWRSQVFAGNGDTRVIVATHPSIADWTCPDTDPTPLIQSALK